MIGRLRLQYQSFAEDLLSVDLAIDPLHKGRNAHSITQVSVNEHFAYTTFAVNVILVTAVLQVNYVTRAS